MTAKVFNIIWFSVSGFGSSFFLRESHITTRNSESQAGGQADTLGALMKSKTKLQLHVVLEIRIR